MEGRINPDTSRSMMNKPKKPAARADDANPQWTKADFARAVRPERILSPKVLAAFRKTRGPQRAPVKIPVSIRLSEDIVKHFKSGGPGWQTRIDDSLRKAVGRKR
ncbi:MAG: BrnA antitoxin family protein [Hyphomicrobiales bacterium]